MKRFCGIQDICFSIPLMSDFFIPSGNGLNQLGIITLFWIMSVQMEVLEETTVGGVSVSQRTCTLDTKMPSSFVSRQHRLKEDQGHSGDHLLLKIPRDLTNEGPICYRHRRSL